MEKPIGACLITLLFSHFTPQSFVFLSFLAYPLCFSFCFLFLSMFSFFPLVFPPVLLVVHYAQLRPFYTTCRD